MPTSTLIDRACFLGLDNVLCLDDFEPAARSILPRPIFEYIAGAAETNTSYYRNQTAYQQYSFLPRVMIDVSKRSQTVSILGEEWKAPFGIAPMGISALSAYRGDLVLVEAGQRAGIPVIMSGSSLIRQEEIVKAAPRTWFQAYLPGELSQIKDLIARVRQAGFQTLVITVDTPVAANRENNIRAGFSTPLRPSLRLAWQGMSHPRWLFGTFLRTLIKHGMPHFENNYAKRGAPILSSNVLRDFSDRGHLSWEYFKEIRRMWSGPLVVKGILHPNDALVASSLGADGIIVSNHGGRQLDGAVSPLVMLPRVVDAVPNKPVMIDSGIRRGSDVLKALALGAQMVFVGRPFAYAAAVSGDAGVSHGIALLASEVLRNMGLLGITRLAELSPEYLVRADNALTSQQKVTSQIDYASA
jgi:L-lactate dehydrogenase (cytochrome)